MGWLNCVTQLEEEHMAYRTSKIWALSVLVLTTYLPCAAVRAETIDELYEKAKAETELVFYTGAGAAAAKATADAFEKRFPGITVTAKGGFSNVLDSEIDQQLKDKKVTADFVQFQTIQDYYRWDKAGALLHFMPEGFDQVFRPLKNRNGAWVAVNAIPLFYGYNPEKVQEADVPKSALDFLKPQFRGKLATVYPTDDDATLYNFYLIVQKYGWDYMNKYRANEPYYIQGHRDVAARVRSGDAFVSFDISQTGGGNLKVVRSEKDLTPVFFTAGGILKNAPHPNAAKLLLTWMLSKEQQGRNPAAYSARADMPPPAGMPPLTDARFANGYRDFLGDGARLPALRKRFEAFTGPVVNKATQ
jgi:ABC-type Fe3+ transport system substrate-binding protein